MKRELDLRPLEDALARDYAVPKEDVAYLLDEIYTLREYVADLETAVDKSNMKVVEQYEDQMDENERLQDEMHALRSWLVWFGAHPDQIAKLNTEVGRKWLAELLCTQERLL